MTVPFVINYYSAQKQKSLLNEFEILKKQNVIKNKKLIKKLEVVPIKKIGNQPYLIIIPRIGLKAAVVEGTFQWDLAKGPGHIETTPKPGEKGNVGISGHRTMYGAPFRHLDKLKQGDLIVFETVNDKFTYKVVETRKVLPTDVGILKDFGDYRITLTTCDPVFSARKRLVVVGKLLSK